MPLIKHPTVYLLVALAACGNPRVETASNSLANSDYSEVIHDQMQGFPNGTQLAFAFIADSAVSYYGIERLDDTLHTVANQDKIFEIGSISKVFTGILLANFIADGTIRADESIKPYLPYDLPDSIDLTFESLSNHTSGLPRLPSNLTMMALLNRDNPYKKYGEEALQEYLTGDDLRLRGVGEVQYSNLGAGLLGYVLTQIAKEDYESLLQSKICGPLGMNSTTSDRSIVEDRLVYGRDASGDITSNWDLNVLVAAGGIVSSAEDMAKFAMVQFDTTSMAMNIARQKTATLHGSMDVGLGWHIRYTDKGRTWHWHNGGTGGYRSYTAVDLEAGKGIVVLANISSFHDDSGKVDQLAMALLQEMLEEPAVDDPS